MSCVLQSGFAPSVVSNGHTRGPTDERLTTMAISLLAPALIAGMFAAGIALAPAAAADNVDSAASAESAQSERAPKSEKAADVNRGPNAAGVKKRPGPNAGTNDYNSEQIPQGWRNDAVWANPSTSGNKPFGTGKRPPVIALD